jgi:hypothetical protein
MCDERMRWQWLILMLSETCWRLRCFVHAVRYARVRAKVRVETRFAAFQTPHPCPAPARLTSVMYLPLFRSKVLTLAQRAITLKSGLWVFFHEF